MAVTSLWPIKGNLKRVIDYARNPEKTVENSRAEQAALHTINGVMEYDADAMKTESRAYVSCINCRENSAAEQFMDTKRMHKKTDGRICYHGYQSFAKGETDAATAHAIGVELAKRLWGDRFEVLIATHCNTGIYHNHFCINSVSFKDGYKFYNSPADYKAMREESDRLCAEYGLSVITKPKGRGKNYSEWTAEQNGKPTVRSTIRADIDDAILSAATGREFVAAMEAKGYTFKLTSEKGTQLKWPGIRPPGSERYFRLDRLGEGYGLAAILERMEDSPGRYIPFPEANRDTVSTVRRTYRAEIQRRKATGLYALYLRYCYELRIIQRFPASAKRVSIFMREDLAKLDRLDAQTLLLGRTGIQTVDELNAYKASAVAQIDMLTAQRHTLWKDYKRIMRSGIAEEAAPIRAEIAQISKKIRELRKEVGSCDAIAERSERIVRELREIDQQNNVREERTDHELFR